jgi:hypothetical protein
MRRRPTWTAPPPRAARFNGNIVPENEMPPKSTLQKIEATTPAAFL